VWSSGIWGSQPVADESFGDQRDILLNQGLAYLAMKSTSQAQDVAAKLSYGDIYAKSYHSLGKISAQQGKRAESGQHYRKFLSGILNGSRPY